MTDSAPDATSLGIDLAVDTSAVIAVLLREPGCEAIIKRLCRAEQPALAAPTRTEILVVALAKFGAIGSERARQFLDQQAIATVSLDRDLGEAAAAAFGRFGRGRHPSGLNFSDCFSYALADLLQVPLLFVGDDFSRTDLVPAL